MPIEHILTDTDTLPSLAMKYLGDYSRWYEIVEFNKLDAPYIVEERNEAMQKFGSGYVTLKRANFQRATTIRAGWTLKTKPYVVGGLVKTFEVVEDVYVPAGTQTFIVYAKCTVPGQFGNIGRGLIEVAGEEFIKNGVQILDIGNDEDFEGGKDIKVLATGDSIFLPVDASEVPPNDVIQMLEMVGGEDLDLTSGFLTEDGFGDTKSVKGLDNIVQAINDRLTTERGELPLHPEYGTGIADIIGTGMTEYTHKLVELEIYEALAYEDRIQNVRITKLEIEGTTVFVELSFQPVFSGREVTQTLNIQYYNHLSETI